MTDNSENVLPNFIGLGVQKGGTSWLYTQLLYHPEVFVPETRKEVHFFDWYYDRGVEWYKKWFPEKDNNFKAIGEFTPEYIYFEDVLPKVKETLSDAKFVVMLRDPVRRAYSHYQMNFQSGDGQKYEDFNDFMESHEHAFKRGLYAEQLTRWFSEFSKDRFLVLVSEDIFKEEAGVNHLFRNIGSFLNINPNAFNLTIASQRVGGARDAPRFKWLASFAQKTRLFLRKHDLDFIAIFLKKMGLTRQIFGKAKYAIPALSDDDIKKWTARYFEDTKKLEALLGREFKHWGVAED